MITISKSKVNAHKIVKKGHFEKKSNKRFIVLIIIIQYLKIIIKENEKTRPFINFLIHSITYTT